MKVNREPNVRNIYQIAEIKKKTLPKRRLTTQEKKNLRSSERPNIKDRKLGKFY